MVKYDPAMEGRIQEAIRYIVRTLGESIPKVAKKFIVSQNQLRRRIKGVPPACSKGGQNKALDTTQDNALKAYIVFLIKIGHQATMKHLVKAANSLLHLKGSRVVDMQWAKRWFGRHSQWFKTIKGKSLSIERKAAHKREDIEAHFKEFADAV